MSFWLFRQDLKMFKCHCWSMQVQKEWGGWKLIVFVVFCTREMAGDFPNLLLGGASNRKNWCWSKKVNQANHSWGEEDKEVEWFISWVHLARNAKAGIFASSKVDGYGKGNKGGCQNIITYRGKVWKGRPDILTWKVVLKKQVC